MSPTDETSLPPIPEGLIPQEEWYEAWIRYGLYVGAVFQLVCILAVILLPDKSGTRSGGRDDARNEVRLHEE